jgi:predicted AAA+ superfamily ATPase
VQELLAEACRSLASEVSWTGIATRVGSNHHTIRNYADTLVLCFAITYLKKFNPKSRRDKPNQNKKVYFEDPFLFHAIRHWVLSAPVGDEWSTCQDYLADSSSRGKLVENIVQNHLIRFAFDQNPTSLFDPRNELFHYNEKGRVIDFILDLEGKLFPFEVRYQSSISSSDSANIVSFARQEGTKAVLITRDQMTIKEHLLEIPASLFLTLI